MAVLWVSYRFTNLQAKLDMSTVELVASSLTLDHLPYRTVSSGAVTTAVYVERSVASSRMFKYWSWQLEVRQCR